MEKDISKVIIFACAFSLVAQSASFVFSSRWLPSLEASLIGLLGALGGYVLFGREY